MKTAWKIWRTAFTRSGVLLLFIFHACKKEDQRLYGAAINMETIPVSDTLTSMVTSNTLLTATHPWYIKGWVYVGNEASLRIEPGAIIHILPGERYKNGGLVVTRGAYIHAAGTEKLPIRFIVKEAGNVVVLGKAPAARKMAVLDNPENGLLSGLSYGGTVKEDSSGMMKHVQIDYPGKQTVPPLLLLGTGTRTRIQHVIQHRTNSELQHAHLP
ncbi:hypothetical protein [Chitinophaga nivalis]|uniref:Uncharacterized protein n=1 Tax=Chitinophaga nivalis TaxID=2991709 RepID=A0ABT3IUC0_9BACT|nr:hypothetical protein [Chitinophaga nivalis]MCW3462819.1 hypothetical protein [Chitinophaga nivalis]MCW3487491.1 hypothetical protein [Chitinophaga nivalis]